MQSPPANTAEYTVRRNFWVTMAMSSFMDRPVQSKDNRISQLSLDIDELHHHIQEFKIFLEKEHHHSEQENIWAIAYGNKAQEKYNAMEYELKTLLQLLNRLRSKVDEIIEEDARLVIILKDEAAVPNKGYFADRQGKMWKANYYLLEEAREELEQLFKHWASVNQEIRLLGEEIAHHHENSYPQKVVEYMFKYMHNDDILKKILTRDEKELDHKRHELRKMRFDELLTHIR